MKRFEFETERRLFTDNAFFLWEHRNRILSDKRMAFCPLYIGNNLAYVAVNGIQNNTLGGYLTWWQEFDRARRIDKHNRRSFIYFIGGSPLSGGNHCGEVYESGKTETAKVYPFKDYWMSFAEAQESFLGENDEPQPYTLAEVVNILHEEDDNTIIEITKADLKKRHAEYNKLYFGGKLSTPTFKFLTVNRPFGQYRFFRNEIWMSKRIKWTEPFLKEVLIHEMIHQYEYEVLHRRGYVYLIQHGIRFHYMQWKLRRKYGLQIS